MLSTCTLYHYYFLDWIYMLFVIAYSLDSSWDITDYQLFLFLRTFKNFSCFCSFFSVIHRNRISFIILFFIEFPLVRTAFLRLYNLTTSRKLTFFLYFHFTSPWVALTDCNSPFFVSHWNLSFLFVLSSLFLLWLWILSYEYGNIVRDGWDTNSYYVLFCLFFSGF